VLPKLSENSKEVRNMIIGYENPIREMNSDDILNSISIALPICAELYCGIRKSEFNETVMAEAVQFIYNYYSELGAIEIKQAFEMASANKFEKVDMKAYYGQFNLSMLGDILSAYKAKRNSVLNKVISENQKIQSNQINESEVKRRNLMARQQVIKEFQTEQSSKSKKFTHFSDIPNHWSKILIEEGIISLSDNRKRELWTEAQESVKNNLRHTANDFTNLYEAKNARHILKLYENPENQSLKDKATVLYGKLYVWEFLK
jgi:hypothetical protein